MSAQNKTVIKVYFEKGINQHDWTASDELVDGPEDFSVRQGLLARLDCNRQQATG